MLKGQIAGARLPKGKGQMTIDSPVPAPIVFVPGVMGTRLKLGSDDAWDPDGNMNMLGWAARDPLDSAKLLDISETEGKVVEEPIEGDDGLAEIFGVLHPDKKDPAEEHKLFYGKDRGWSGVAAGFYYDILVRLEKFFNSYPFVPGAHPVHAFGYDWRQGNSVSGKKLAEKIGDAVKTTPGATKAVLVTHSMGGLVARHAVHADGGKAADKVKGVIHVVQPINGAVQAYRRFAEGVDADKGGFFDFKAKLFANILGGSFWGYTLMMSGTEGPLQLLPNQVYGGWLTDLDGTPVPAGNIYDFYVNGSPQSVATELPAKLARKIGYKKLGEAESLGEETLEQYILADGLPWDVSDVEKKRAQRVLERWKERCAKLRQGVLRARDFHKIVIGTAHKSTFVLYASDRRTEIAYDWSKEDEDDRLIRHDQGGDGTVPTASASGLDKQLEKSWKGKLPVSLAPHQNTGAQEHGDVFKDDGVGQQLELRTFFYLRLDKPPEAVPAECVIQTVELECEHTESRKYKAKLPAAKDAKQPVNVIEIVAAGPDKGEKIKTAIDFAKPRCDKHAAHALLVKGPEFDRKLDAATSTVSLYYREYSELEFHQALFGWLWPWNEKPVVYTLSPQACHSPASAILVRVYPAVEPSITLKFALKTDSRVEETMAEARTTGRVETRGRPPNTDWKLEFAVAVKYGDRKFELTKEWEGKLRGMASANLLIKRSIDKFSECFYKYTGVTILPVFPKLSLKYEGSFKEISGTGRVGTEWSITFKADPIIGITAKVDILKAIIQALAKIPALTALMEGLDRLRELAEEHGQKFEISLAFTGQIGGEVGAKKSAKEQSPGFTGAITGKIKVDFEASASLGCKSVVEARVGAEVKAGTGISASLRLSSDSTGVFMSGKLGLIGCKLEYAAWASVKVFWEVKESIEGEFTFWEDMDLLKSPDVYLMRRDKKE